MSFLVISISNGLPIQPNDLNIVGSLVARALSESFRPPNKRVELKCGEQIELLLPMSDDSSTKTNFRVDSDNENLGILIPADQEANEVIRCFSFHGAVSIEKPENRLEINTKVPLCVLLNAKTKKLYHLIIMSNQTVIARYLNQL